MKKLTFVLLSLVLGVSMAVAQSKQITGTVIFAEDGEPIIGASVVVKGTTTGTVTDLDGNFVLSVPTSAKTIVFSYVGMETVALAPKPKMNITMHVSSEFLDEIMVVAYGTAKKSTFTGSASSIKADKISQIQSSTVTSALEGRTAGVQLVSSTGQPGENPTVRIRGIGSINASKTPLYVVDGAFYDGPISAINSADIESMTVLKDAAANSLYGARGANGVILITTKRTNSGGLGVTFDAKWGVNSRAVPEYDLITDPGMYYEQTWKGQYNKLMGSSATMTSEKAIAQLQGSGANSLQKILGGYNNYDVAWNELIDPTTGLLNSNANLLYSDSWNDALFSDALRQEYNFSIGESDEKQSYYIGLGYLDDNSYAKGSSFSRLSGRIRYEKKLASWLKVGANLAYSQTEQDYPETSGSSYMNYFQWTRNIAPIFPVLLRDPKTGVVVNDDAGTPRYDYGDELGYARPYAGTANPAGALNYDVNKTILDNISGGAFVEVDLGKGLSARGSFDVNTTYSTYTQLQNPYYGDAKNYNGRISKDIKRTMSHTGSGFLTYKKVFGQLSLDAMAGAEAYNKNYQFMTGTKSNLATSDGLDIANAVVFENLNSYTRTYSVIGMLGRVNLSWADKYYLSGSFRRDASSHFAPENRWGNFGSVGGSWRISQESFLKDVEFIDNLQLKASVGTQGNDGLLNQGGYANYQPYLNQFDIANLNGEVSLKQTYLGNRDITWEKSLNSNIGLEVRFLNRINFAVEYFNKKTTDMLFQKPLPVSTGFATFPENIGSMTNTGFEMEFDVDVIRTNDWLWNIGANITRVKNEVTKLPAENKVDGIFASGYTKMVEGGSIYDLYLPEFAGVNEHGQGTWNVYNKEGEVTGVTTNQSDVYNSTSRRLVGSALPDLYGGVNTTLNWKGIDLSVVLSYQIGGDVYDAIYASTMQMKESGRGMHKDMLNAWTPENQDSSIPEFVLGNSNGSPASDNYLESASYLNIRNISIGYTLPRSFVSKLKIHSLRFYGAGDNLALFSARKGLDPRQYDYGTTGFNYSPIRSISFGLNVTL